MKDLFRENFKIETFKKSLSSLLVPELTKKKRVSTFKEYDDVNQTQLTILCSLNGLTKEERSYAIRVYNEILGGSSTSMLFTNVRGDNSLCYYINSLVKPYDNILLIYSGISNENVSKALKLIKKTMTNISNGKIPDELLKSSIETITSSITTSMDNPNAIIDTYYAKELVDSEIFEDRIKKFNEITKQDIINLIKNIK